MCLRFQRVHQHAALEKQLLDVTDPRKTVVLVERDGYVAKLWRFRLDANEKVTTEILQPLATNLCLLV
jgi:hypothetical protein